MPYNDYDAMVGVYVAHNEQNVYNAYYERPAMLAALGDVAGKRILDAGCGAGTLSAALLEQGADVCGVDSSAAMVRVATRRVGERMTIRRADLADPLDFADDSFDVVVASLVMHYLADWVPTLKEFVRVLRPGGRFVMSTHHPFVDHELSGESNYFATYAFTENWPGDEDRVRMRFWHRPLRDMIAAFRDAGLILESVDEPRPLDEAKTVSPRDHERLRTRPAFLFLTARKPAVPVP